MITILCAFLLASAAFLALQQLRLSLAGALGERIQTQLGSLRGRLSKAGAGQLRLGSLATAGALICAAALYLLSDSWVLGVLGAGLGLGLPWIYARLLERQQVQRFSGQLASALDMLSGALKSGQSLNQALQTAALELPQPAAGHFALITQKLSMGDSPESALEALAGQMQGQPCEAELRMLSTSVAVTRTSGGNLAEILAQLSDTMRERARLRAEIDAMTAQGKLSGWIVGCLPLLILGALNLLDPGLVAPMFHTPIGLGLLGLGLVLELIGGFLIRRIVSIDL